MATGGFVVGRGWKKVLRFPLSGGPLARGYRKAPSLQCSAIHSFPWQEDRYVTC